jgi:hypothetical protein
MKPFIQIDPTSNISAWSILVLYHKHFDSTCRELEELSPFSPFDASKAVEILREKTATGMMSYSMHAAVDKQWNQQRLLNQMRLSAQNENTKYAESNEELYHYEQP